MPIVPTKEQVAKLVVDPKLAAGVLARIENRRRDVDPRPIVPLIFNPGQNHYYIEFLRAVACQDKLGRSGFEGLYGKPRQVGVSTLVNWLGYYQANFEDNTRVTILAHEREAVQNILAAVKRFYKYWPHEYGFLLKHADNMSRSSVELENGSRYVVHTANSEDAARSFACDFLHLSEYAHYASDSAIGAAMAMVPAHARVFKESTARGQAGAFYEEWQKAKYVHEVEEIIASGDLSQLAGWSGAYKFFWPWYKDPQNALEVQPELSEAILKSLDEEEKNLLELYPKEVGIPQLAWRRWKIAQIRHDELNAVAFFKQEFPSNDVEMFQASGNRVFNANVLTKMLEKARLAEEEAKRAGTTVATKIDLNDKSKPKLSSFDSAPFWVYAPPEESHNYTIGVDASMGLKTSDPSVIIVIDRTDGTLAKLVAIWKGKIGAIELGEIATNIAEFYNNAYIVPEVNNMGIATARRIVENRYPFVYHREAHDIVAMDTSGHGGFRFGFYTSGGKSQGKRVLITRLSSSIEENLLDIPDIRVIRELLEFENHNGELRAPPGKNDDCVMALALAMFGHMVAAPPVRHKKKVEKSPHLSDHDREVWAAIRRGVERFQKRHQAELKRQEAEFAFYDKRAKESQQ